MATEYTDMKLTAAGRDLQSRAQTGTQLIYTRMAFGDGILEDPEQISELTALISEKASFGIGRIENPGDGTAIIGTVFNNNLVETSFYSRELGLFANDPIHGEILFSYGNCGEACDLIPRGNGVNIVEESISILAFIGEAQNVSAVIDASVAWVTQEQLEKVPRVFCSETEPLSWRNGDIWYKPTVEVVKDSPKVYVSENEPDWKEGDTWYKPVGTVSGVSEGGLVFANIGTAGSGSDYVFEELGGS